MAAVDVPRGWQIVSLGDLFDFSNGVNADKTVYGAGTPFVNVLEVITHEALIDQLIPGRIKLPAALVTRYHVQYGDVLFNRTSETQDEVGLASVYVGHSTIVFGGFVFRGRPKTNLLDIGYSKYALRAHSVREQIVSRGQGGIRANIAQRDLKTVCVVAPPLAEQRQIAAVLTHIDDQIAALERVVAKKEAIKQGMAQQVLTGATRLPGFSGSWVSVRVASCSVLKARIGWQGLTTSEYRRGGTYRLVGGTEFLDGGVAWHAAPYVDKWRYDQDLGIQLRQGDVLLTKDGTIGKTAYVGELPSPATLNSGVFVIRPCREAYYSRFLYYMLRSRAFDDFLSRLTAGSTISHLYQRDLVGLVLAVPPTIEEQKSIAELLADADRDLDTLRARLNKAKAIKQGMMQELLTGRIRLPIAEAVAA
jgi:type I restriction enzyme, S subunit